LEDQNYILNKIKEQIIFFGLSVVKNISEFIMQRRW